MATSEVRGAQQPQPGTPRTPRTSDGAGRRRGAAQLFHSGFTYEGLDTAEWTRSAWQQPSIERAKEVRLEQLFQRGEASLWRTSLVDLEPLGPGLPLYFLLLRYLSCFFIFATLLALPIILFSMAGSSLDTVALATEIDAIHASFISIAAIGLPVSSADNATLIPLPSRPSLAFSRRGASVVIMSVDLAMSLLFLVFTVSLSRCIAAEARRVHRRVPQAADYAVYVTGLPTDATEEEVRAHFSTLYDLHAPDWTFASSCCNLCWSGRKMLARRQFRAAQPQGRPRAASAARDPSPSSEDDDAWDLQDEDVRPVRDIRNTENDAYRGSWVAEVTIATANGALLAQFQALVGLFQRLRTARARVLRFSTGSEFADPRRHTRASKQLEGVERSVDAINRQFGRRWRPDVVGAFVVFNNEESRRRCLADYGRFSLSQATPLRFRGEVPLRVVAAPDPSQVVWENLELSACSRWRRRALVFTLVAVLLAISTAVIIAAQSQQARFSLGASSPNMCGTTLPAVAFNVSITPGGNLAPGAVLPIGPLVLHYAANPDVCPAQSSRFYWTDSSGRAKTVTSPSAPGCLAECWADSSQSPGSTASCFQTLSQYVHDKGPIPGTLAMASDPASSLCAKAVATYLTAHVISIFVALVVGLINYFLRAVIVALVRYEGHPSVAAQQEAVELKLFLSMFINTSLLVLLTNSALASIVGNVSLAGEPVLVGQQTGFSVSWHVTVGASIVLTMILTNAYTHVQTFWLFISSCSLMNVCRARRGAGNTLTQAQLNAQYSPPPFELPARLAVMLNVVFSCLMYSAGNPVLLAVAAASMLFTLVVDKGGLLRVYGKPPHYAGSIVEVAVKLLPIAGLVHMAVAVWTYSDETVMFSPNVFAKGDTSFLGSAIAGASNAIASSASRSDSRGVVDRLTQENTFPIFVAFAVIVGSLILRRTVASFIIQAFRWLGRLLCCCCAREQAAVRRRRGTAACCCGGDRIRGGLDALLLRPPFCEPYEQVVSGRDAQERRLSDFEAAQGWRIVADRRRRSRHVRICTPGVTSPAPSPDALLPSPLPPEDDLSTQLLSWEVIQLHGIASYDPLANPRYYEAVRALEAARLRVQGHGDALGVGVRARMARVGRAASARVLLNRPHGAEGGRGLGGAAAAAAPPPVAADFGYDYAYGYSEQPFLALPPGALGLPGMEFAAAGYELGGPWGGGDDEPRMRASGASGFLPGRQVLAPLTHTARTNEELDRMDPGAGAPPVGFSTLRGPSSARALMGPQLVLHPPSPMHSPPGSRPFHQQQQLQAQQHEFVNLNPMAQQQAYPGYPLPVGMPRMAAASYAHAPPAAPVGPFRQPVVWHSPPPALPGYVFGSASPVTMTNPIGRRSGGDAGGAGGVRMIELQALPR